MMRYLVIDGGITIAYTCIELLLYIYSKNNDNMESNLYKPVHAEH